MSLNKTEIVASLQKIINDNSRVVTDEQTLKENSVDRYRKFARLHKVYEMPLPSAVVFVNNTEEIAKVLKFLNDNKINCTPKTGGTATEGGLENWAENTVVINASNMKKIIKIDPYNMQVTAECGVTLGDLEKELEKLGLTTGHSPQSKPIAQLGGLLATRSIGQFSTLYGGIEDMVVGLECVFPDGTISRIKNVSRRAAGPDIRHIAVGNEGALCYISEVTLKLHKFQPEHRKFFGYLVDNVEHGIAALRQVMVDGFRPAVCRWYSEEDARQHFAHFYDNKCVLIFMTEGPKGISEATAAHIEDVVGKIPTAKRVDSKLIENWFNDLNWGPDKLEKEKEDMLTKNNLGYTTEVSADWETIVKVYHNVINRIKKEFPRAKDLTMLGGHSSHSYINGTNMYFVYDYDINCSPSEEIELYHKPLNGIIVEEVLKLGGSIAHHHGIGKYRTPWTKIEHGTAYHMLEKLKNSFDPNGIMNYGTIFPTKETYADVKL